jgi:hypothetical protein
MQTALAKLAESDDDEVDVAAALAFVQVLRHALTVDLLNALQLRVRRRVKGKEVANGIANGSGPSLGQTETEEELDELCAGL